MRCSACGARNGPTARFCDQCGARLEASIAEERSAGRKVPLGDRRIVTALFADLVDYSRMVAELDPEDVRARVDTAFDTMARAIEHYDGTLEKFIGDAVFAVFGAPRAHDDDAVRAGLCALEIRDELAKLDAVHPDSSFEVRIGIATGEVVAAPRNIGGEETWALIGEAITAAARLQQLADPGEIVLDEPTLSAARHRLDAVSAGTQLLRGHPEPIRLYRLRAARPGGLTGIASPGVLVGRTEERRKLREALTACATTGRGRVILIDGEAGIGKSRLIADLEEEARAAGFAWTWTENVSYATGDPYGYARQFAERVADEQGTDPGSLTRLLLFGAEADPAAVRRYAGAIAAIARDAAFSGWEAEQPLVPADPAAVASALLEVTERFAARLAETYGPRVLIVDDLHWADHSSLPMIERLIEAVEGLPFLVIVTRRPEPPPAWASHSHVERIVLGGLDTAETGRLAAAVAGGDLAPADVRRLYDRTEGNPLFIGETIRALLDDGSIERREGRLAFLDPDAERAIPVSLRALLGARIDALPDDARVVLQVASVIGMSFTEDELAAVLGDPETERPIERLLAAALLVPGEDEASWRFGHQLIHDVAYAGILASRRRELHGRLADRLEGTSAARPLGQLAAHRAAAGDPSAVDLFGAAAEAALAIGAVSEAAGFWQKGARLLGSGQRAEEYLRLADEALAALSS